MGTESCRHPEPELLMCHAANLSTMRHSVESLGLDRDKRVAVLQLERHFLK